MVSLSSYILPWKHWFSYFLSTVFESYSLSNLTQPHDPALPTDRDQTMQRIIFRVHCPLSAIRKPECEAEKEIKKDQRRFRGLNTRPSENCTRNTAIRCSTTELNLRRTLVNYDTEMCAWESLILGHKRKMKIYIVICLSVQWEMTPAFFFRFDVTFFPTESFVPASNAWLLNQNLEVFYLDPTRRPANFYVVVATLLARSYRLIQLSLLMLDSPSLFWVFWLPPERMKLPQFWEDRSRRFDSCLWV